MWDNNILCIKFPNNKFYHDNKKSAAMNSLTILKFNFNNSFRNSTHINDEYFNFSIKDEN